MKITGKHFIVKKRVNTSKIHLVTHTLRPDDKLVFIGHGWSNPGPGVYLHVLEIWRNDQDTGIEVDIDQMKFASLIKHGSLEPQP